MLWVVGASMLKGCISSLPVAETFVNKQFVVSKMRQFALLLVFFGMCQSADVHRITRQVPPGVTTEFVASTCVGCTQKITVVEENNNHKYVVTEPERFSITEEEFTALRIEYIKNQILKKLRLKEKPSVMMAELPKPADETYPIFPRTDNDDYYEHYIDDDFYGKTTQAIIFPYEDAARCIRKIRYPSACLPFQMPTDITAADVSTAELFFYKEPDISDAHNQTFVISEVAHWDSNKSFQKTKPIAIQETSKTTGWLKIDVAYVVKNWLQYQDSPTHAINVVCKTCGMNIQNSPVSFQPTLKPFLVIHTHSQPKIQYHRRSKRQINCQPGANECCRESLHINFSDIGWNDWIIHPQGYNAYYCKGSCATAASLTLSATQHNTILNKIMYGPKSNTTAKRLELTPCCAATQFKPLNLYYLENNKTITSKLLTNMIVDACGCM